MRIIYLFSILFITSSILSAAEETPPTSTIERRAAIDVGSGSTKVTIADVDTTDQKIIEVVFEDSFPVPYQAALESSYDGSFDDNVQDLGIRTFTHIKEVAEDHQVEKIRAVATAAFRDATNGERFASEIESETGIPLRIIPQKEEGTLAFFSGIAASDRDSEKLIVWDIGTGSFQMTTLNELAEISAYMGSYGSIPFKNYIIDVIQEKDPSEIQTPNPMTPEDIKAADAYARSLGRKALPIIKDKVRDEEIELIGIGRLFSNSIGPLGEGDRITRKDLRSFIESSIGLSDEELNNPYASVDVSNAILVLGFMKALHIQEIKIVDSKSSRGMLIYTPYWE